MPTWFWLFWTRLDFIETHTQTEITTIWVFYVFKPYPESDLEVWGKAIFARRAVTSTTKIYEDGSDRWSTFGPLILEQWSQGNSRVVVDYSSRGSGDGKDIPFSSNAYIGFQQRIGCHSRSRSASGWWSVAEFRLNFQSRVVSSRSQAVHCLARHLHLHIDTAMSYLNKEGGQDAALNKLALDIREFCQNLCITLILSSLLGVTNLGPDALSMG